MRYASILLLLAMLYPVTASSQFGLTDIVIAPGIRIGGSSGDEGGFTGGFELSVTGRTTAYNGVSVGLLLDYDISRRGRKKLHFGAEASFFGVGLDIGPTLVLGKEETRFGFTATPFAGLIFYPYYSITFLPGEVIQEGGAYFKLPVRADGESWRFH